jgi:bifunctional DNA-binding transcriptional regulator/antitoxin component of YhaV-PrlF toxin-antitoxin module
MAVVKERRRRGVTRLSAKNQVTIPVDALRRSGLKSGDVLKVESAEPGKIMLSRTEDPILKYAGVLKGVYPPGYLKKLRGEWRY